VYEEYARAAPKDLASKAAARAAALRRTPAGAKAKKTAAKTTPDVDGHIAPEGGGTMVMPSDDGAAKKPAPKKTGKSVR
jgi:hypothetical protein